MLELVAYGTFLREVSGKAPMFSPGKLLALGLLFLGTGGALFFDIRTRFLPPLPWVVMAVGIVVFAAGVRARRQRDRLEREVADVLARWQELAAGVQAAEAAGQSTARFLQQQGIRTYAVRRFVLHKLQHGDGDADTEARPDKPGPGSWLPGTMQARRQRPEPPSGPGWLGRQ